MNYCKDCGSKVFDGACTWCHEEVYIAEQYYENGDEVPERILKKINSYQDTIDKNKRINNAN